ncbi:helix-turn-helix transcriptional regulator [Thiorhodococcus minor]|uniref:Helix-turn-helix transcriptional regulator n=1 Tax=Thiorhodococcus minor TaxID=57489 RepID=A0A6M0K720_9GAMM|nr:helix-turn-helix transcriptional regulator [Thiorhodococcus minor]NEV64145.1 helix-turn-helix transcriptional regulator [Thiorhodococcus minor]
MTELAELKARLLEDPETRAEYEALEMGYAIARELIAARTRAGLSQEQVAERMGTSQSTIARLESGRTLPSLRTLDRYARATGSKAVVRLEDCR